MFAEMANHNPAAIAALYAPDANLAAVIKTKDGKSVVRSFTGEKFSQNFAVKKGVLEEVMYAPETKIFGDLALVWGRYVFFGQQNIALRRQRVSSCSHRKRLAHRQRFDND
jgi:cytolysin (calcineurin-like family phosphatase)